jgi:hypothetical protein
VGSRGAAGIAFAALAAFGAVAACSLGNFTGFSGGDEASSDASVDGAIDSREGEKPDAATDDASVDAGDGGDAGGDGATTGFCLGHQNAGWCEDFDGPVNALTRFIRTDKQGGGTFAIDNSAFLSAPSSFVASIAKAATDGLAFGVMKLPSTGSKARLSISVRLDARTDTAGENAQFLKVWFFPNSGFYEVSLSTDAPSNVVFAYEFDGTNGKSVGPTLPAPALGTWTRFVVEVDIGVKKLLVDRDGNRVMDATISPSFSVGSREAAVGIAYVGANHGTWQYRFDDVLYEAP